MTEIEEYKIYQYKTSIWINNIHFYKTVVYHNFFLVYKKLDINWLQRF